MSAKEKALVDGLLVIVAMDYTKLIKATSGVLNHCSLFI